MRKRQEEICVIGSGPAGSTAAALLAREGYQVCLFSSGKRPPLLVGESLVPAIIPILRLLGVEEEVKSYSTYKPGATFYPTYREELTYPFRNIPGGLPPYAYNSPRNLFDQTIEAAAVRAGAKLIDARAELLKGNAPDTVRLSDATIAAAGDLLQGQPDLIIDASGRTRQIARLLDLPSIEGDRKDAALFAHLEGVTVANEGFIHIDRLKEGWAWRIPLPGRLSLGIVIDSKHLKKYGESAEEQYDALLKLDPVLNETTAGARRVTPVMRYTNYQMRSTRAVGANWALAGDAAGFIDPIFSSGLYIAMESGVKLAEAIKAGTPDAMARYERYLLTHLGSWQQIISYFYSGRLLTLLRFGREMRHTAIGKIVDPHMQKHFGRIFTGAAATARYSLGLLRFMATYGITRRDHRLLRIN